MLTSLAALSTAKARSPGALAAPPAAGLATTSTAVTPAALETGGFAPSLYPKALDVFVAPVSGGAFSDAALRVLSSAVLGAEKSLAFLAKASPGDWAHRLTGRTNGAADGGGTAQTGGLRLLGGSASSEARSPVVATLTRRVSVLAGLRSVSVDAALDPAQVSALGVGTSFSGAGGIAFLLGARLEVPSGDPSLFPPSSLAALVCARVDDGGALRLILRAPSGTLAPGTWLLHALFVRSAYVWPSL